MPYPLIGNKNTDALKVTPLEYEHLKHLSLTIINKFSDSWPVIFLGVGRTPTPLMAFIECYLGKKHVITLPLSGFRHNYPGKNVGLLREPLTCDQMVALSEHLRRFIPIAKLKKHTQFIVVDFVDSGASLAAATYHIKEHLRQEGHNGHVSAVALCTLEPPTCFIDTMSQLHLDYFNFSICGNTGVPPKQHLKLGRGNYYDPISPFNRPFKISDGHLTEELIANKVLYHDYMRQISEYMIRDISIENPLSGKVHTNFKHHNNIQKYCDLASDARVLHRQFNSFPSHVNGHLNNNTVNYNFINGETLECTVLKKTEASSTSIKQLAHTLGDLHWSNAIKIKQYGKVCTERGFNKNQKIKSSTYGYFTQIHGDLHLRNMLVTTDGELIFIDRMRQCGDLMFDFPFILSLLCFSRAYNDNYFYSLVVSFFSIYEQYVEDKLNFYRAFLINFVNYAQVAYAAYQNSTPPFTEIENAAKLSKSAANYNDFNSFLVAEFGRFSAIAPLHRTHQN